MNDEDYAYLQAYVLTVDEAEDWLRAMEIYVLASIRSEDHQGQHRDPYDS